MQEPKQDKYARLCSKYESLINAADNPLIKARITIDGERVQGYFNTETGECVDKLGKVLIQAHRVLGGVEDV